MTMFSKLLRLFCRHQELPLRLETGNLVWRCAKCGAIRLNILSGLKPAYHLTEGTITAQASDFVNRLEWEERKRLANQRVLRRYQCR